MAPSQYTSRTMSWRIWLPLTFAVVSGAVALYVAAWAALGVPGSFLERLVTDGDPKHAPVLIGALGIVATVAAILTGVGELHEAFPPQQLFFWTEAALRGRGASETAVVLHLRNEGAFINGYRGHCSFVLSSGVTFSRDEPFRGERLIPGEEVNVNSFAATTSVVEGGSYEVTWWADRSMRGKTVRVPVNEIVRP